MRLEVNTNLNYLAVYIAMSSFKQHLLLVVVYPVIHMMCSVYMYV